ncbi:hypothetical protein N7540_005868 [Penicillium herquei]|nr:hypothetical protein N7540_005868 [Penicillium herquei]
MALLQMSSGVETLLIVTDFDEKLPAVFGAAFDSYADQHEEKCLLGTRTDILCQIKKWAFSPQERCILWLNGMAGTGKSTISRTVAEYFSEAKTLGASFFFKKGEADRGSAIKLFPTIARQMTTEIPKLLPHLRQAVLHNPGITGAAIKEQFDKLLLQPLLRLERSDLPTRTIVIVLDALDECEGDNDIRLILQLLPQLQRLDTLHMRVFLTSRPELPVRLGFSEIANQDYKDIILHEIPEEVIKHDISLFLHHRLSKIRSEFFLPDNWPGEKNLEKLVALSFPLFIFAATICRIFADPNWDPIDSLTEILACRHDKSNMDRTYLPVFDRLLVGQTERQKKQLVEEFQQVVGSIVMLEDPLSVISISKLLNLPERFIQLRLKPFYSVLKISTDSTLPVRLFHLSFRDFLLDRETRNKTPFTVDEKAAHYKLTVQCLSMCQNLRKNICELPSDGARRAEIDRHTVDHFIPPELNYSCRYWVYHLVKCNHLRDIVHQALLFLEEHFLHWVEVMSLLGFASEVVGMLSLLQKILSSSQYTKISEFLHDAKRFMLKNVQIADDAPLQLYCSGLIFAPRKTIVRRTFQSELPIWIHQLPQVEETWNLELQTLEGHSGWIRSMAFSPNGALLASGSSDQTIRLWDMATGTLQQTLEGHSGSVRSVAFSPNGALLASSSTDWTVRLWDIVTGTLQRTFKGHLGSIESMAFSPKGILLASGSSDKSIQLWDTATGILQQTLKGHSGWIRSIAFSPNGALLASGSSDQTIRLWDMATGTLQQTLKEHSGSVRSVAFSPNGALLASGSNDTTVRLWDTATCTLQQTLEGHSGWIRSMAFSPNGALLASGSIDKSIRLWDTATYTLQQTLDGHSDSIESLAFSPNGVLLASGSIDKSVRLWDTTTGALQQTLDGHSGLIESVAFSPSGMLLASGSSDHTLRLWDIAIGTPQQDDQDLQGHLSSIKLLEFSPNGSLLASGSINNSVQLWDTATGALQQTLNGHSGLIESVAFSPNNALLASGSNDQTIQLWDLATYALQQTLKGHSGSVESISFSPNSALLVSSFSDRTIQLWNTATGAPKLTFKGHSGLIKSIAFSPNGALLAFSSGDKTVRLWDTATGALQQTLKGHGHSGWIRSVAFSPNGALLASSSSDQTIQLWNTATGTLQQNLVGVRSVADIIFDQDGSYLTTNLASLTFHSVSENHDPSPNDKCLEIGIIGHWIMFNGKKALWLPPGSRPSCSAISSELLALGHSSGRISFLRFRV